ncbi:hypothetical protein XI03_11305 [Bradyrhizobium sp. CCBAU 65884]|uniref:PD-(D/E)XK motif protein n=1 Tax=Bradyrhizobium sp. CCBAU 65884 TaxID=722477 RepID=UPI0023057A4B|nr:PD-(D/E)XK motif protein [Bradyrhizobium sp. CCBAU 65884]MDA9475075.1 hypothetical protein [Bradyrhizobium sp. CCBAU 65884]
MTGHLEELLKVIGAPSGDNEFNVRRLENGSAFYAGRDNRGNAAVLIETSDSGRTVPLRLAGIEATFSMPYTIVEQGKASTNKTLTAIVCTIRDDDVVGYFANLMESVLPFIGRNPSTSKVADTVRQLVELFQKLRAPARRSLVGLVGELSVIEIARDVALAVKSWRSDPQERFDFAIGKLRLDVKASSNRQRVHEISFEQANPPSGATGLIASVWVEPLAGGISLADLLRSIEEKIAEQPDGILRLRSVVASTLGDSLPQAMLWRFDGQLARSSMRYFDASIIPAIRPPLPPNVSSARFVSDLSGCDPVSASTFRQTIAAEEQGLLP